MSLKNYSMQQCPVCGTEQKVEYYQSVNATLDPTLKEKVLSGKLNSNFCQNCQNEINIVSGFLYHDMEKMLMLEFSTIDHESESLEDEASGKEEVLNNMVEKGYIYRKVFDYYKLLEKIKIFDYGLNDEIIDKISNDLKNFSEEALNKSNEEDEKITMHIFFNKIEKGLFKTKISFHCFSHPSQIMEMKYDLKNLSQTDRENLFNLDKLRNRKQN